MKKYLALGFVLLFRLIIIFTLTTTFIPYAGADELCVGNGPSGTACYENIQSAIEDANPGNVITVYPGTYKEKIDFLGKEIIVKSPDPNDPSIVSQTIIDGSESGSVVTFNHRVRDYLTTCGPGTQTCENGQWSICKASEDAEVGTIVPLIFKELVIRNENAEPLCVIPVDGEFRIVEECIKGDVNRDGEINAADAILILRIAVGKLIPNNYQACAADVNGDVDGYINSGDTILVLRAAVRKVTIFLPKPDHGMPETIIKIIGWNFGDEQGGSSVYFGDIPADPISWGNREIITTVPSGIPAEDFYITVVNEVGTASNPHKFTVSQGNMRLRAADLIFKGAENPRIISMPTGIMAAPCEQVAISVDIDDAADIAGMDLGFTFDPDILTPVNAECTDLTGGFLLMFGVSEDGQCRVSGARDTGIISGAGAIINLVFDVSSNDLGLGSTGIVLEDVRLFDENADPIQAIGHQNGEILINEEDLCDESSVSKQTYMTMYNNHSQLLSYPYGYYYPSYFYNPSLTDYWTSLWSHLSGMDYSYLNNGFSRTVNPVYPSWMQNYYGYHPYSWNVQELYPDISWCLAW